MLPAGELVFPHCRPGRRCSLPPCPVGWAAPKDRAGLQGRPPLRDPSGSWGRWVLAHPGSTMCKAEGPVCSPQPRRSGSLGSRGKPRAGSGALWEHSECRRQRDFLGAAGACCTAEPEERWRSGSASREKGSSSGQRICSSRLEGGGGESGAENHRGVIV